MAAVKGKTRVTQERDGEINEDAMAAIREAVEERQRSFGAFDDEILELNDIVWRSPSRPVIDPTDTITHLAEEADKVARGMDEMPPQATILRQRAEPDFGMRRQRTVKNSVVDEAEAGIQALVTASLKEQGKIGPDGKLAVSEEELRLLVRQHIDKWVSQHMTAPDRGGLQNDDEMRKNAIRDRFNDQD